MVYPEPYYLMKLAAAGALAGALLGVTVMFLGLKLNLKGVRSLYQAAGIPITGEVYMASAVAFGAMGAVLLPLMPILDAKGVQDPWYGLAMMAAMLPFGFLLVRHLRKLRRS
jgi:hypothetical protein